MCDLVALKSRARGSEEANYSTIFEYCSKVSYIMIIQTNYYSFITYDTYDASKTSLLLSPNIIGICK